MAPTHDDDAGDDALVEAALSGEARAFEALVCRHETRVLRVLRLLGVRESDREDVAQEVFLKVFRHLGSYTRGRSFSSWIYKVAVNASYDWRGQVDRIAGPEVPWNPAAEERPAGETTQGADRLDLARRLEAALDLLTERERAVFVLVEIEGLDGAEVARAMGISAITVRRHLGLARVRLQKALDANESTTKAVRR